LSSRRDWATGSRTHISGNHRSPLHRLTDLHRCGNIDSAVR
jgi:hypothetical protein